MSHDHSNSAPDTSPDDPDLEDRDPSGATAEHTDDGEDTRSTSDTDDTSGETPTGFDSGDYARRRRIQNRMIDGRLVAHFTTRDVSFAMDGATALAVLSDWQRRPVFMQQLEPDHASAELTWLGIDLTNVLGFSWHPRRPDSDTAERDRRAFDGFF